MEVLTKTSDAPRDYDRVLVLGAGFTGKTVALLARSRGLSVLTYTRSDARALDLRSSGFTVETGPLSGERVAAWLTPDTHVVVAFPPDGVTDALIAGSLEAARSVAYVSSTGVYGSLRGRVDDGTEPPTPPTERAARILDAEQLYRALGATVLRCPGIYGADRGLHRRVLRGEHRIPGEGDNVLSRIHVFDLAQFLLAAPRAPGETFVVADLAPAKHIDVVRYISVEYGVPMPESVPAETLHESLRADRAVDSERARRVLGVTLAFPTFLEGMRRPTPESEEKPA